MIDSLNKHIRLLGLFALIIFVNPGILAQKSNVLFIAVDDLKPVLNCYGESQIQSPNIDKLAEQGIVFNKAYCQWSVCGPSRASILTGLTPDGSGIRNLKTLLRDVEPEIVTLPQYFKKEGYITAAIGKVFDPRNVDSGHDSPSWSLTYKNPSSYQYPSEYGSFVSGQYRVEANTSTEMGPAGVGFDGYQDGQFCLDAIAKLDDFSKSPDSPFFLAVGFKKPHIPFIAPKAYWDLYNRDDLTLAPFQKPSVGSPDYAYHNPEPIGYTDIPDIWTYNDIELGDGLLHPEDQKRLLHGYYACVSYIDDLVGKILQKLDDTGLADNTIIVFWGDHGYHLGDHNQWGKHTNFEHATKVPLIISVPGGYSGRSNETVDLSDLYPTLVALAGNRIPEYLQGEDLSGIFNSEETFKTSAVSEYRSSGHSSYSFRTGQYRYTVWNNGSDIRPDLVDWDEANISEQELFDYHFDSLEKKNLVNESSYQAVLDSMKSIAKNWWYQQNYILNERSNPAYLPGFNYVLNNPDFELGSSSGWIIGQGNGFQCTYTTRAEENSENQVLSVDITNEGVNLEDGWLESEFYQCFSALRGKEITASFSGKSSTPQTPIRIKIRVVHFNGMEENLSSDPLYIDSTFDSVFFSFKMPESVEKWKYFIEFGSAIGELVFDNINLSPMTSITSSSTYTKEVRQSIVYPNPATNVVFVDVELDENTTLFIRDLNGKIVRKQALNSKLIDVSDLEGGIYFFQIPQGDEIISERIVIMS